jgi:DNA repair exonuclease SbcCD ATPase subunit
MTTPTEAQRKVSRLENDVIAIYEILGEIKDKLVSHDERFDAHDTRFDRIDARLDAHDTRFDRIDARLDAQDARLNEILDLLRGMRHADES